MCPLFTPCTTHIMASHIHHQFTMTFHQDAQFSLSFYVSHKMDRLGWTVFPLQFTELNFTLFVRSHARVNWFGKNICNRESAE